MRKEIDNEWYKECDFIQERMQFYSMKDFINNFPMIKKRYDKMKPTGKKLYQWYIFAKPYLSNDNKKNIWDMLNLLKCESYEDEENEDSYEYNDYEEQNYI